VEHTEGNTETYEEHTEYQEHQEAPADFNEAPVAPMEIHAQIPVVEEDNELTYVDAELQSWRRWY